MAVEKWLDLLTPSAAALALLLVLALLVQAIRHGRAVRRLEARLAEEEGAAARVSLDRLQQLQRRATTSSTVTSEARGPRAPRGPSRLPAIAAVATVLGLVGLTSWYVFVKDDGGDSAAPTQSTETATSTPTPAKPPAASPQEIPATPEPLPSSKAAYTILALNGSGINRAAGDRVNPAIQQLGWQTTGPKNAPGLSDLAVSFVIYIDGKEIIADNIGKDLGIKKKEPLSGFKLDADTSNVDAIVVVGKDLAERFAP